MFWQAHSFCRFLSVRFQEEPNHLLFLKVIFSFFDALVIRLPSLGFQPILARLLQTVFREIYFFPLIFALVAFIPVWAIATRVLIRVSDVPVFLYTFLAKDFTVRTIHKISLRISDEVPTLPSRAPSFLQVFRKWTPRLPLSLARH